MQACASVEVIFTFLISKLYRYVIDRKNKSGILSVIEDIVRFTHREEVIL